MKNFIILIISLILVGCSLYQVESKDTSTDFYPPKKTVADVVYQEKISKNHEEIGIVSVTTERRQNLSDVMERMKYEAAILGGDAITDIRTDSTGVWKSIKPEALMGNAYIRAQFTAKVIKFK